MGLWRRRPTAAGNIAMSPRHRLWCPSEELAPEIPPRWGAVLSSGVPSAVCDPLGGRPGPSLGSHPRHVGQTGFPPAVVWYHVVKLTSAGCGLCVLVHLLVAQNSLVSWDPKHAGGLSVAERKRHGQVSVGAVRESPRPPARGPMDTRSTNAIR